MNLNEIPDPPRSPIEKLVTAKRALLEPADFSAYLRDAGFPQGQVDSMARALTEYEREKNYKLQRYLDDMELWANIHTHKDVVEPTLPLPWAWYRGDEVDDVADEMFDLVGNGGTLDGSTGIYILDPSLLNGQPGVVVEPTEASLWLNPSGTTETVEAPAGLSVMTVCRVSDEGYMSMRMVSGFTSSLELFVTRAQQQVLTNDPSITRTVSLGTGFVMLAATVDDATGVVKLYLDGVEVGSTSGDTFLEFDTLNELNIDMGPGNDSTEDLQWLETQFFISALDADEVAALWSYVQEQYGL